MTREELLELAALDVYGLLDEYEAALFTRSFHHAPVTVQNEIVDLQAEIAADETLLADVAPPPADLRRRVLQNVARAIEQENAELEPIASIGHRNTPLVGSESNGRSGLARFFGSSGQFWRAACFALCGAVVVLVFFWREASRQVDHITEMAIEEQTLVLLGRELKPMQEFLFDPATKVERLGAEPGAEPSDARASVLVREESGDAFLVFNGLPDSESKASYTLTVTDASGDTHELLRFASRELVAGFVVELGGVQLAAGSVWTISTADGVLLRSS